MMSHRASAAPRRMRLSLVSLLAALVASVAFLFTAGPAAAASYACTNSAADQSAMQTLIDAGGLVTFTGTCLGNYDASINNVTIKGVGINPTFDGSSDPPSPVLLVHNGITVNLQTMTLRGSSHHGVDVKDCNTVLNLTATTVRNNSDNFKGGGIDVDCAALKLTNSTVTQNTSGFEGGGIAVDNLGTVTLVGSTVSKNTADVDGGGIDVDNAQLVATASTIFQNSALGDGGTANGGGIKAVDADVSLKNTTVSWNTALAATTCCPEGGGVAYEGGSPFVQQPVPAPPNVGSFAPTILTVGSGLTIADSSIDHNRAGTSSASGDGGGLYVTSSSGDANVTITNTSISYNQALGDAPDGGGILNHGTDGNTSSIVATGLTLAGNTSLPNPGGSNGDGGGLYQSSSEDAGSVSTFSMSNGNTGRQKGFLNSNKAWEGGGIYNDATDNTSTVSIGKGVQVTKNQATSTGGGILHEGDPSQLLIAPGAIVLLNSPNNIVFQAT